MSDKALLSPDIDKEGVLQHYKKIGTSSRTARLTALDFAARPILPAEPEEPDQLLSHKW